MDNRNPDQLVQLREVIDRALSGVNTCIPGIIESFDPSTQTCSVIPAIQMRVNFGGDDSFVDYPIVNNAPIIFPFASTGGFALTLPVKRGDACVILFSQRAIDNWHDKGGVQPPEDSVSSRHHDLTDAIVLLAAPPSPDVLGDWETDGISIRNKSNDTKVTIYSDNIVVKSPTTLHIDTPLTKLTGNMEIDGGIRCLGTFGDWGGGVEAVGDIRTTAGDVVADTISLKGHTHPGDSGGTTGPPNA